MWDLKQLASDVQKTAQRLLPWARSKRGPSWLPFVQHPPIDRRIIRELCNAFGLTLPGEYVAFLSTVGNGGLGPTTYPLNTVAEALFESARAGERFNLTHPVTTLDINKARHHFRNHGGIEMEDMQVVPYQGAMSDFPDGPMTGALAIGTSGCDLDFYLIVDQQSARYGEVWLWCDSGAAPVGHSFLSWWTRDTGQIPWHETGSPMADASRQSFAPDTERAVADAGAAMESWVSLVQEAIARNLHLEGKWTVTAARDVRREATQGCTLAWERQYADQCYRDARQIVGDDVRLLKARAWAEVELEIDGAEHTLEILGEADGEAGFLCAQHAANQGNLDRAIDIARRTCARYPDLFVIQNALATFLCRAGDLDESSAILDRLISEPERDWEIPEQGANALRLSDVGHAFVGKAIVATRRNDSRTALRWIRRALNSLSRWEIASCADLEPLQETPDYREVMAAE